MTDNPVDDLRRSKKYLDALGYAYLASPEEGPEERSLELAYIAACERLGVDADAWLEDLVGAIKSKAEGTRTRTPPHI